MQDEKVGRPYQMAVRGVHLDTASLLLESINHSDLVAEFRKGIKEIVMKGFKDSEVEVRIAMVEGFCSIGMQGTCHSASRVDMLSIVKDLPQDSIWELIPDLLKCLDDSDKGVRTAAVKTLCGLGKHGTCHGASCVDMLNIVKDWLQDSIIQELIPNILKWLDDDDEYVQIAAVTALRSLGEHGMYQGLLVLMC